MDHISFVLLEKGHSWENPKEKKIEEEGKRNIGMNGPYLGAHSKFNHLLMSSHDEFTTLILLPSCFFLQFFFVAFSFFLFCFLCSSSSFHFLGISSVYAALYFSVDFPFSFGDFCLCRFFFFFFLARFPSALLFSNQICKLECNRNERKKREWDQETRGRSESETKK